MLQMSFTVLSAAYSHLMNPEVSMNLRNCFGEMISSPSFAYSLVSFSTATCSMHSELESQTFQKWTNPLLLSFLFLSLCLLVHQFIIPPRGNRFCPATVVTSHVFNILFTFYVLKSRNLQFHRSNKSQAF